jgi:hypothetical protein
MSHGKPLFAPGQQYAYTDTGEARHPPDDAQRVGFETASVRFHAAVLRLVTTS